MYIREDLSSRLLQCKSQCNTESLSIEINMRKRRWLLNCSYNFHRNSVLSHLEYLNRIIDEYSKTYDNFIFMKGFNIGIVENFVKHFCDINFLKSLIKVPTNSKNPDKPICIDVILLNRPNLFQHRNQCF